MLSFSYSLKLKKKKKEAIANLLQLLYSKEQNNQNAQQYCYS